jgi:S-adenosylmethionine:tRNA ribosyltransferase-isomerase
MTLVTDFYFDLPQELIAQHPPAERGASRMLVLSREQGIGNREQRAGSAAFVDARFRDLPEFLRRGDLLVLNDSRVLPARLYATRAGLATQANSPQPSGLIEVLLVEEVEELEGGREQGAVIPASQDHSPGTPIGNREQGLVWRALAKPARKVRVGETLEFRGAAGEPNQNAAILPLRQAQGQNDNLSSTPVLTAEVVGSGEFGERTLRFSPVEDFYERVARIGHMPLPPYIHREQAAGPDSAEDQERYQTVFSQKAGAQQVGSAAAPTAGLHFTPEILDALRERGVEIATITLHVGLGTFQPVRVSELKDIRLHAERYTLPAGTAEALNRALREGRRVIAVGTTTTRTLEHIAAEVDEPVSGAKAQGGGGPVLPGRPKAEALGYQSRPILETVPGRFTAHSGSTSIFIGPGHRFRIVKGLLTNFHLPESTLLMLVSAFAGDGDAGRQRVLAAYAHAIREGYRFYSYGDCMLVL